MFQTERTERSADRDPAGIVFFPPNLVTLNTLVEEWFDEAQLTGERRLGLPTVRLEVGFTAISRHGDRLRQRLAVARVGRNPLELQQEFPGGGELRLRARQVLVCTSLITHRPQPLPEDVRAILRSCLVQAAS